MSSFRIPRREIEARVLLESGQEVTGRLFAPQHGPHGEPGTIEGRLGDTSEPFVPLVRDDDTLLISVEWILAVTIRPEDADLRADDTRTFDLSLRLAGGTRIDGTIEAALPQEESRLLDYLNSAPRFIPVRTDEAVVLVNRAFLVGVSDNT